MKTTIVDVAKACNVSVATVSRVINGNYPVKEETKEKVLAGVRRLSNSTTRLVIVTNEVNADINGYSEETEKYRECIGMVNQSLAEFADIVTEVVYGIPVYIRKEQKKYEEYKKNME